MKISCIQINSINSIDENLEKATVFIKLAAADGAEFVLLPENVVLMSKNYKDLFFSDTHSPLTHFCFLADELNIWILIGSLSVKSENTDKLYNRSFLINNNGDVVDYYDKINLFDIKLENGEEHFESKYYEAGKREVVSETPWGKLGMTICYDLRFPNLYQNLVKKGANFISVPAAFTEYTGKAHWEILLRARAIENKCYIFAPAQTGEHPDGKRTFGHSMIIDPWGTVLQNAGIEEGYIIADVG